MAEAALVVSIVNGSLGLAIKCGNVAKALNDLASKYKRAELDIKLLAQHVDIIKVAWQRIKDWSTECRKTGANDAENDALFFRLAQSLECGDLIISAIENDLEGLRLTKILGSSTDELSAIPIKDENGMSSKQKTKFVWNETSMQCHRERVRDQSMAMLLLMQVLNLRSPRERKSLLIESEPQLQQCDESAYSIVPSRMYKISISSTGTGLESVPIGYQPTDFDDDLFNARVYKRNYRDGSAITAIFQELSPAKDLIGTNQSHSEPSKIDCPFKERDVALPLDTLEKEEDAAREIVERIHEACIQGEYQEAENELRSHSKVLRYSYEPHLQDILEKIVAKGHVSLMEAMIKNLDEGELWQLVDGKIAIFRAVKQDDYRMADLLLNHGVPIDSQDSDGNYAIHHAISAKATSTHYSAVLILLNHGSRIDWQNESRESPLSKAIDLRDQRLVSKLLLFGNHLTLKGYKHFLETVQSRIAWQEVWPQPGFMEPKCIESMMKAFLSSTSSGEYNFNALA